MLQAVISESTYNNEVFELSTFIFCRIDNFFIVINVINVSE